MNDICASGESIVVVWKQLLRWSGEERMVVVVAVRDAE